MADHVDLAAAVERFCAALGSEDLPTDGILTELARSALEVLDVDGAGVMAVTDDDLVRVAFASDGPVAELELLQEQLQNGPCHDANASGLVINLADLSREGDWPTFQQVAVDRGMRAVTAVPLQSRGRSWGVLDVYRTTPRRLDADDLRAAATLARLAVTYLMVSADRDAARQAQEQLAQLAMHDPLTELPVRWVFLEHLARAIADLTRRDAGRDDRAVAVLFLDLDGLKYLNDTRGHAAGDDLLVECARRIRAAVRPGDVVARIGGDEFVVLLDHVNELGAVAVAQRVLDSLRGPAADDAGSAEQVGEFARATISASIGIALTTQADERPDTLLAHADAAMYEAKRAGAGRYALFDPGRYDAERVAESMRVQIGDAVRTAVLAEQFELHYQPIVEITNGPSSVGAGPAPGGLVAVEALIRWRHPQRGLLAAGEFLPVVDNSPLMLEVGAWVLRTACRQLAEWDRLLGDRAPARLFVNLSVAELAQPGLVPMLAGALQEAGINGKRITIEVTESGLALNAAVVLETIEGVRTLGCTLAIDDFGSGYSSLSRLERMPADVLKVDGSFARDLHVSPAASAIVSAVLLLGRSLDRTVVVEGVEDEATVQALVDLGCTHLQGFHLGRPMPADAVVRSLT